jgi:hypothetical protein
MEIWFLQVECKKRTSLIVDVCVVAAAKLPVGRVGLEPPYRRRRHGAPPEPP